MRFLKRLGRALADILTSKKAIATIGGVLAHQLGADPEVVIALTGYVVGQGIADHGKEAARIVTTDRDRELADKLRVVREGAARP